MPHLRPTALTLLLAAAISCSGTCAQTLLPPDWLATLTLREPLEVLPQAQRLAGELGLPGADAALLQTLAAPRFELAGGRVVAGLAAPAGDLQQLYLFVATPTPPAALVDAFDGDLTGDIGIFSVGGLEFAARSHEGMTLVVPLDQQGVLQSNKAATSGGAPPADHDLTLRISEQGLAQLKQRAEQQHAGRGRRQRVALNEMGWPPSPRWIDAAIGENLPLAERITSLFNEVSLGVSLTEDGVQAEVLAEVTAGDSHNSSPSPLAAAPRIPEPPRTPIASVTGDARDGSLRTLVSLWLAYSRGRPDELEASSYPPTEYSELEGIALAAADLVTSIDAVLLTRSEQDPFYSNRAIALGVTDAAKFTELLASAAVAWNQTVSASDARIKLNLQVDRQPLLGDDQPSVTRFVSDLGTALEDPPSADTQAIMQRYYGQDGLHVAKAAVLAGDRVLLADVSETEFRELAAGIDSAKSTGNLAGELWLDRYAAWQNAILSDYMADAIGFTPPHQLPESPLSFTLSQSDGLWRLHASAPQQTVLNFGRRLLAKRDAD